MGTLGGWSTYPPCGSQRRFQHYRYHPSYAPTRTLSPRTNTPSLQRPRASPSRTYFSPTRLPTFDLHSGDDSDLDLSDDVLSQVLEEADGDGDGERGGSPSTLTATSTEKLRQAKDLWDLRWSRWWGYNWSRKRDEALRKQRVHMSRTERGDHSVRRPRPATPEKPASEQGEPDASSEESTGMRGRVWRRLLELRNSSSSRIHAFKARLAERRRVLFKKSQRSKLKENNLIDFETNTSGQSSLLLIPDYLMEATPAEKPDVAVDRASTKPANSSDISLASLEHLAMRLQLLQSMDDCATDKSSDAVINVSRGTSPISIFSAKSKREATNVSRAQQAYRLMVEKSCAPSVDAGKMFNKSDHHFDPVHVLERTQRYPPPRHPAVPAQHGGKPTTPPRASAHDMGAATREESHRPLPQPPSEAPPPTPGSRDAPPPSVLKLKEDRDLDHLFKSFQREREASRFVPTHQPFRNYSLYKPQMPPSSYTGPPLFSPLFRTGRMLPPDFAFPPHYPSMKYSFPFLAPWLNMDQGGHTFSHDKLKPETADNRFRSISTQTEEHTVTSVNTSTQKSTVEIATAKKYRAVSTQTEEESVSPVEEVVNCCHQTTSTHFTESCGTQTHACEPPVSSSASSFWPHPSRAIYDWLANQADVCPSSVHHQLSAVPERSELSANFSKASTIPLKGSSFMTSPAYNDDEEQHVMFIDYESLPEIKSSEDLLSPVKPCDVNKTDEQATQTIKSSRKKQLKLFFQRKLSNLSSASE